MEDRQGSVELELTPSEALVLFEYLWRFSESDDPTIVDSAERDVLCGHCCSLESILVEPFQPEYQALLKAARAEVRGADRESAG